MVYDGLPYPVRRLNADGSGLLYRYDEEERRGDLAIRHRHDAPGGRTATELPDGRLIETADDAQGGVLAIG